MIKSVTAKAVLLLLALVSFNSFGGTQYYIEQGCATPGTGTDSVCDGDATDPRITLPAGSPGDDYSFKRGTTYTTQIDCTSGASANDFSIYSAHGTGAKPIIRVNNNVFLCQDEDWVRVEGLDIRPTLSTAAGIRADRPEFFQIVDNDFNGGLNGVRMEGISAAGVTFHDLLFDGNNFYDQTQNGIFTIIGNSAGLVEGYNITARDNYFTRIGKEAVRFTYQNAVATTADHRYYNFIFEDNIAENLLRTSPSSYDNPPHDQCFHFRNIRETVLGKSWIKGNRIYKCGRTFGESSTDDVSLITGFWFEGMTKVIVQNNSGIDIRTPGTADGGIFFLDSSASDGTGYNSEDNLLIGNYAQGAVSNRSCVPFTSTQCNNSEGFSLTRAASNNTLVGNVAVGNNIGFHVAGNVQENFWYWNTATLNDYGFYLQTNSGDTPAGEVQVLKNNISYGNTIYDYQHESSPKANETYNIIGTINGDTIDATSSSTNPLFVQGKDLNKSRAKLQQSSPACGAGTSIFGNWKDGWSRSIDYTDPSMGAMDCNAEYRSTIGTRTTIGTRN